MKLYRILSWLMIVVLFPAEISAQSSGKAPVVLSTQYEELTAPDFIKSVEQSGGICLLPMGIIEKHGPHLPLGSDLFEARELARRAASKEYCVVFPPYYIGQINEAKHQPGAVAYSHETIWNVLQETCNELARNGFKKIIIVNGHGGNGDFLNYFCMSQLESAREYTLMIFQAEPDSAFETKIKQMLKTKEGGHADEAETSMMLAIHPGLVKLEHAADQSGADQNRLSQIPFQHTGIWWYAKYPNHYAGDGSKATAELGNMLVDHEAEQLVQLIRKIKTDNTIKILQDQFYQDSKNPLKTKQ